MQIIAGGEIGVEVITDLSQLVLDGRGRPNELKSV